MMDNRFAARPTRGIGGTGESGGVKSPFGRGSGVRPLWQSHWGFNHDRQRIKRALEPPDDDEKEYPAQRHAEPQGAEPDQDG